MDAAAPPRVAVRSLVAADLRPPRTAASCPPARIADATGVCPVCGRGTIRQLAVGGEAREWQRYQQQQQQQQQQHTVATCAEEVDVKCDTD